MRITFPVFILLFAFLLLSRLQAMAAPPQSDPREPLTVIAIGDAGESGSVLRGNSTYISEMFTGQHDAGPFQALIFLGDNFTPTGLNIPAASVQSEIESSLRPFKVPMDGLGKERVHAIPGEHDYYARNALESSVFFGLIKQREGPSGISDKGNVRASQIPGWTYHYRMPARFALPLESGGADSAEFIFFDSAVLLRSEPATWHPELDSLRRMLRFDRGRQNVLWRVLCTHHPLASVGEHGGYSVWNEDDSLVEYLTSCDRDSNPSGWVRNWLDPEDVCAPRYRQYVDSLAAVIRESQAVVHAVLSSHDRSLQLLDIEAKPEDRPGFPHLQIISGAGSGVTRVKFPSPPHDFTAALPLPRDEGYSAPGFLQMRFTRDRIRLVFFSGKTGNPINMGAGQTEFWIDRQGKLVAPGL